MSGGKKFDQGKSRLDLINMEAMFAEGDVLAMGALKYDENNWKKGIKISRLLGAALRHIFLHMSGQTLDSESGLMHLAHARCNLGFAIWMLSNMPEMDDRLKKEGKNVPNS